MGLRCKYQTSCTAKVEVIGVDAGIEKSIHEIVKTCQNIFLEEVGYFFYLFFFYFFLFFFQTEKGPQRNKKNTIFQQQQKKSRVGVENQGRAGYRKYRTFFFCLTHYKAYTRTNQKKDIGDKENPKHPLPGVQGRGSTSTRTLQG